MYTPEVHCISWCIFVSQSGSGSFTGGMEGDIPPNILFPPVPLIISDKLKLANIWQFHHKNCKILHASWAFLLLHPLKRFFPTTSPSPPPQKKKMMLALPLQFRTQKSGPSRFKQGTKVAFISTISILFSFDVCIYYKIWYKYNISVQKYYVI